MGGTPKSLADIVESLAGAVFVDSNFKVDHVFQVMRGVITPLPDPNNVPIEPTRLLRETASKANSNVKFDVVPQEDRSFTVHVYIDTYLLASAYDQPSRQAGKVTGARIAQSLWDPKFD